MQKDGIPLFFAKLDPKAMDLDPMLVSGFFSAVQSFSSEVIEKSANRFQVDYGARLFTVFSGNRANLIAISIEQWDPTVEPLLEDILKHFEKEWLAKIPANKLEEVNPLEHFAPYREYVIEKLNFDEFDESWIPVLVDSENSASVQSFDPVLQLIDGYRTINDIIEQSGLDRETVMKTISTQWAKGSVKFHNMLSTTDIVITTSRITPYLQSSSPEYRSLLQTHPEIATIIPKLASILDGRRTVGEVIEQLQTVHNDTDLFLAFDYLMDRRAIEPLSPERRRILLLKEALDIAYRVAEKIYGNEVAVAIMQEVINQNIASEVIGEIRFENNRWVIEYDSKIFEGIDKRRIMMLYSEWMKVLAKFVSSLEPHRMKKYVETLVNEYFNYLFEWYKSYDFIGFEEFSYWLEWISYGIKR